MQIQKDKNKCNLLIRISLIVRGETIRKSRRREAKTNRAMLLLNLLLLCSKKALNWTTKMDYRNKAQVCQENK